METAVAQDKAEVISEATDLVYLNRIITQSDLQWYGIIAKLQKNAKRDWITSEGRK